MQVPGIPVVALALLATLTTPAAAQSFVNYESPQTHAIELSPDGTRLFAVNTPDNRVAIFALTSPAQPVLLREVVVGLEPVAVRYCRADEIWVVNYLSDSISIVSIADGTVRATLQVGDEPTDVVFAQGKAFVAVAGTDQVRVFDVATRQALSTIDCFGDEPRHLLASPDGKTVWAVVHRSGNGTTILPNGVAPAQPAPTNKRLPKPPQVGLIIDATDPAWRNSHDVVLPDYDLIEIDVGVEQVRKQYPKVGTTNFGAALRPGTDEVWVANTQARNAVRFVTDLRGHTHDNRVTRVATQGGGSVTPFDLNPGINYATLPNPAALATALAQPTALVWNAAGTRMYVAAFGTDRIGIVDALGAVQGFIEVGDTAGSKVDPRRKRGPRALVLHDNAGLLYVLNRLANSITAIDIGRQKVCWELGLPDPTPVAIKQGRGFLYDAKLSGNGTSSCAACHVDGDVDGLAWDLGDPGGEMFRTSVLNQRIDLHPMKGPMVTQTLKGLSGSAPFHWRGDKPRLQDFNPTFDALLGKTPLSTADMDAFAGYMESIGFGANPNLGLDGSLPSQSAIDGQTIFTSVPFRNNFRCIDCHAPPTGSNQLIIPAAVLQEPQAMKVAQLRNIYKKLDFKKTPQGRKSGFGMTHDGAVQDMFDFLSAPVFGALSTDAASKTRIGAFVLAFDTGTPPSVGRQVTVDASDLQLKLPEIQALRARAEAGDIDLVVKGRLDATLDHRQHGFLYQAFQKQFEPDTAALPAQTWGDLQQRVVADGARFTLTGVPRLSGRRIAIDRDDDGVRDGDDGVERYGAGTKGCQGVPVLDASSEPRLGNPWFSLVASRAPARAMGILGIGVAKGSLPLLGVTVLLDVGNPAAVFIAVSADGAGELALALPIPDVPGWLGLQTYSQLLWADACGPQGLSASPGLGVKVTR
jgi:DNA-binding beta-propeller fold protein YncE